MLVGVVGARPVADDECSAKETLRLVTMFDALLEGASQWFLDERAVLWRIASGA